MASGLVVGNADSTNEFVMSSSSSVMVFSVLSISMEMRMPSFGNWTGMSETLTDSIRVSPGVRSVISEQPPVDFSDLRVMAIVGPTGRDSRRSGAFSLAVATIGPSLSGCPGISVQVAPVTADAVHVGVFRLPL